MKPRTAIPSADTVASINRLWPTDRANAEQLIIDKFERAYLLPENSEERRRLIRKGVIEALWLLGLGTDELAIPAPPRVKS
jgi:hypothetical protein